MFNNVRKTKNLNLIHRVLSQSNQYVTSFNLGYNKSTKKYKVASLNAKGDVSVSEETYPRGPSGRPMTLIEHGDLQITSNGDYKISGIGETIRCPNGYTGETCKLKPLCGPGDEDKLKPITLQVFSTLGLFNRAFQTVPVKDTRGEAYHKRLRIHCLSDDKYQIENCPPNKLLDENLNCVPYDLCEDRLNGYKHNLPINSNDKLNRNEYYTCVDNKSKRNVCLDKDAIFSEKLKSCIPMNECVGKGNITLPVDEHSYILCRNDQSTKVFCKDGVQKNDDGRLSCVIRTCRNQIFSVTNDQLRYNYGEVKCTADDVPITKICDNSANPLKIKKSWAKDFDIVLLNWPKEIYINDSCKEPTLDDGILINPVIDVAWSDAMARSYPYDLLKQRYVCPKEKPYRWNYDTGELFKFDANTQKETVYKLGEGEFAQSCTPCQERLYSVTELPWGCGGYETLPANKPPLVITLDARGIVSQHYNAINYPFYDAKNKTFDMFRIKARDTSDNYGMYAVTSSICPAGFELTEDQHVRLIGTNYTEKDFKNKICYFSYGRNFDEPQFDPTNLQEIFQYPLQYMKNYTVNTEKESVIGLLILMKNMKEDIFYITDKNDILQPHIYLNRINGTINVNSESFKVGVDYCFFRVTREGYSDRYMTIYKEPDLSIKFKLHVTNITLNFP